MLIPVINMKLTGQNNQSRKVSEQLLRLVGRFHLADDK